MAMFKNRQQSNNGGDDMPTPPQDQRPKIFTMIEHLGTAQAHMAAAMDVCSSIILDLEKGAAFIGRYRESLIRAVADAGGDVVGAVEHEIRDFIPKNYRPPEGDNAA